jgi:hypothetical protein
MTFATMHARRRRSHSEVLASAVVLAATDHYAGAYLVEELSTGGALLVGDPRLGPGEHVKMLLQLPGRKPVAVAAEVLRRQVRGTHDHLFAVAFRDLSPATEDMIERVVLASSGRAA